MEINMKERNKAGISVEISGEESKHYKGINAFKFGS